MAARAQVTNRYYDLARKLGRTLAEAGFVVATVVKNKTRHSSLSSDHGMLWIVRRLKKF
ncbi:MAG: hypothetical protein Q8S00_17595 [Deltaproteobacteria bacterium]|nr:hypothetical protein [Deltaproteobacteria bacterium]MDZ4346183.1 hypothetical protein [Candidatus Binatia bacterium]